MSSIGRILASMGALAGGYVQGEGIRRSRERDEENQAFLGQQRARMQADWQRQDKLREDMGAAAAPTTVEDAPMAMPIGSRDEPRAPEDVGIRAAGRSFTSRPEAEAAATAYNAQPARYARMSQVLEKSGDPMAAQQLRASMRQEQLAELQLDEAKTNHLNKLFDDNLQKLSTHDDIAKAISESTLGGDMKLKPVASADGKRVEYQRVNPDGSTTPTGYSFGADSRGVLEAKQLMGRLTPVSQKLDYLHKQSEVERAQSNVDRDFTRSANESDRDFQLRKLEADRRARHDAAVLANDTARVDIARAATEGRAATAESTFDSKTAADIAKDQVQKEADEARQRTVGPDGKPVVWTAEQIATRKDAIVQALFQQHTSRFIETAATKALAGARGDPVAYAAAFEKVQQLGVPLKRLSDLGFKPPATPRPAPVNPMDQRLAAGMVGAAPRARMAGQTASPMPVVSALPAPAAQANPVDQLGVEVDNARAAMAAAMNRLQAFGLRQRAVDPRGFAAAEQEARQAEANVEQATAKYQTAIAQQPAGPAVRYALP